MNESERKRGVGAFPQASTEYTQRSEFIDTGGDAVLRCYYVTDGTPRAQALHFGAVRAYRFRAESHCEVWHVEDAYEHVVEVLDSDWVRELTAATPKGEAWDWIIMRHFLIYVEDAGAFEVIAASVEWLPEERILE